MKPHPMDPFSLVFGVTFALIGLMFMLTRINVESLHLSWVWPIPLVVLGGLIIALAVRRPREDDEVREDARDSL